ncbi:hypothetical protein BD779DRAFT_50484 [Infundibulicybe gibba]|nr:hypothetical protein BD779DRAFT_50484 [Infundibulicybe gibba]
MHYFILYILSRILKYYIYSSPLPPSSSSTSHLSSYPHHASKTRHSDPHLGTRFDTLPSSPPVSPLATAPPADAQDRDRDPAKKRDDKMPHDASIFVGSLPSNIEQPELTRMLAEHLSEHTEIKNIKVVRDSKGGVCAFVQCEDSVSAAILINTLHSAPPKPFMGRILRYEPARAFRTLIISYRAPTQFIPAGNPAEGRSGARDGEIIKLDLPFAMRIWRPKNTKFYNILYNAEAVDAEAHSAAQNVDGSMADGVLFLKPVLFDAETVRRLAAHFGRLEKSSVYQPPGGLTSDSPSWQALTGAHDAPRSENMDGRCWEIKWEHRDDCMSALTTLRRVPHFTVTWAHQPSTGPEATSPSTGSPRHVNRIPHLPYVQEGKISEQARCDSADNAFVPKTQFRDLFVKQVKDGETGSSCAHTTLNNVPDGSVASSVGDYEGDGWRTVRPQRVQSRASDAPSVSAPGVADSLKGEQKLDWSEIDFPPLGDVKEKKLGQWASDRKTLAKSEGGIEYLPFPPTLATPGLTVDSTITLVEPSNEDQEHDTPFQDEAQELDMPSTPGLGMSPLTPKTSGSTYPVTPTSAGDDGLKLSFTKDTALKDRELDPMTLFVGGLEMFGPGAWDEEKVTNFFSRFGGLESVKLVRPMNSRAAFAFVKFNNTESPARAVFEEHNRVYEGRAMRVQFRDFNPSRASWKFTRGRGRYQNQLGFRRYPESNEKSVDEATRELFEGDGASALANGVTPLKPDSPIHHEPEPAAPESSEDVPDVPQHPETTSPKIIHPTLAVPAQPEHYREWYDDPNLSVRTPPLSSLSSSTSNTNTAPLSTGAPPCPAPVGGYYPPQSWVNAYPQQMPYQIPYFGMYPGYPMVGQQTYPSPAGSETSGPTTTAPLAPWPGTYGSYIPYPMTYPRVGADQPQQSGQAPVIPHGFIQNDQGTLIAVYQPEAIDQYMADGQVVPQNPSPHTAQHVQPQVSNVPSWPQYPPSYPVPNIPPHAHLYPPPMNHNIGWLPGQPPMGYPLQPPQHPGPTHTNPATGAMPFRGGHDAGGQNNYSQHKRQPGRRDQHSFNGGQGGRNNNQNGHNAGRSYGNRHGRGGVHNGPSGFHSNLPLPQSQRPPQIVASSSSGDWSHWSAR